MKTPPGTSYGPGRPFGDSRGACGNEPRSPRPLGVGSMSPGTNLVTEVDRRVQIRVGGEPTVRIATKELGLRCSVCLLTVPTAAACLARVRRVHIDHWHTSQRRLVGDEGSKLEEGPTVKHSPLALNRSLRTLTDALQIFEGNPARSAFCRADEGFRQTRALDRQWLISRLNRFSLPLRFLSSCLALFVPFFWSFPRMRL